MDAESVMALQNTDWQTALKRLQPSQGGVQPPAQPGGQGNLSYAPGMMSAYNGPQAPLARQLQPPGSLASEGAIDVQPGGQASAPGMGGMPGIPGQMDPMQAQGFLASIMNIIRAQNAARGKGGY
jgi:hypothetical protein